MSRQCKAETISDLNERMMMKCARMVDKNKGGGNFCSSGASEGGAEAIGANLNQPVKLGLWQQFLWQKRLQSRGGGRRGGARQGARGGRHP